MADMSVLPPKCFLVRNNAQKTMQNSDTQSFTVFDNGKAGNVSHFGRELGLKGFPKGRMKITP